MHIFMFLQVQFNKCDKSIIFSWFNVHNFKIYIIQCYHLLLFFILIINFIILINNILFLIKIIHQLFLIITPIKFISQKSLSILQKSYIKYINKSKHYNNLNYHYRNCMTRSNWIHIVRFDHPYIYNITIMDNNQCVICRQEMNQLSRFSCDHWVCRSCCNESRRGGSRDPKKCPACNIGIQLPNINEPPAIKQFSVEAPFYRSHVRGLNLGGKCSCVNNEVICQIGLGQFNILDLVSDLKCKCPNCKTFVMPESIWLNNCIYAIQGTFIDDKNNPTQIKIAQKKVGNQIHYWKEQIKNIDQQILIIHRNLNWCKLKFSCK